MSKVTRRRAIRASVTAGAALIAGSTSAGSEQEKPLSFLDRALPEQLKKEEIQAAKGGQFTKLEFAGSTFWVKMVALGCVVPRMLIGIYAPDEEGVFHRSLFAESWAAAGIGAAVDAKTGLLELRERANTDLKGQLVLACNLKTIGTPHSIKAR